MVVTSGFDPLDLGSNPSPGTLYKLSASQILEGITPSFVLSLEGV